MYLFILKKSSLVYRYVYIRYRLGRAKTPPGSSDESTDDEYFPTPKKNTPKPNGKNLADFIWFLFYFTLILYWHTIKTVHLCQ